MMLISLFGRQGKGVSHDPAIRGYHVAYREDQVNHCPGCGRSHWHIGRISVECGFCGTALPLTGKMAIGAGLFRPRARTGGDLAGAA
ncbi:MAG: hypothetical protein AB7O91_04930 [Sphingomonas sp.]